MAKYKVSVSYEGCVEINVDADNEEQAEGLAILAFEDLSAVEIETNICCVYAAESYETEEGDD